MSTANSGSLNDDERAIIENYRKLPEENKKSILDLLIPSKNINDNLSNISEKDNPQTSAILSNTNNTSDDKLIETGVSDNTSQLSQTECKYLLSLLNKSNLECADLNTQDQQTLISIIKKNMKHIVNSNEDELDINTQQFIDLNVRQVAQQLQISELPQSDVSKKQTIELMDSDDFLTSLSKESRRNIKCFNKPKLPEKCNYPLSTNDVKLSDQDPELLDQYQSSEIVTFQDMCDKLMTIRPIGDNDVNNSISVTVNNHVDYINFKQVNPNVISCTSYEECAPSTSKFNSTVNNCCSEINNHEHIVSKKHKLSDVMMLNSSEYPDCKYKKSTFNSLKNNSTFCSDKIVTEFNTSKKINLINELSSSEDEDNHEEIKRKLPVTNRKTDGGKRKKIKYNFSLQENFATETSLVFPVSPYGFIHEDMLKYVNSKNNV